MKWLLAYLSKFFKLREQKDQDVVKPFLDHLEDLRVTLFKMVAALAVGMVVAYCFKDPLMGVVEAPLAGTGLKLMAIELTEPFMVSLKLAFYGGLVLAFPALLYFVAEFVLPALTRKEKRMLLPAIAGSFLLFAVGVYGAYVYVLPKTIQFFVHYAENMQIQQQVRAAPYFGFVSHLLLACGLLCELPVVMVVLALLDILSYALLRGSRPYAYTGILILVAIISPSPDPITFFTLSVPVLIVYEFCIGVVWAIERRRKSV